MIDLPLAMSPPTSLMKLLTNPFIGAGSGWPIVAPNSCSRTPSKLWLGSATVMGPARLLIVTRSEFGVAGSTGLNSWPVSWPPGGVKPSMWSNERFSKAMTITCCGLGIRVSPTRRVLPSPRAASTPRRGGQRWCRQVSTTVRLKHIESPDDPDLARLWALMDATFADPDIVLGLDRMQEFLAANRPGAGRRFFVVVATNTGVVGGTVFSYIARSACGFSEYILVDRLSRGTGLGRALFDARQEVLNLEARRNGYEACRGLFIEADNPLRLPADVAAIERETAMEARERLRLFDHLGFRRVDVPYVQPALAANKQ